MPTIHQSAVKPFKHKGSVFLPKQCSCLLTLFSATHASALSAQPSHCWSLMDSAYTCAHTRRKKSFSPLASLWRSSNQMSYAAHSWSLFISKTKALPTTSCLPLMSQRGCSPVFVSDSELEKERNALRHECYRVNIDANC